MKDREGSEIWKLLAEIDTLRDVLEEAYTEEKETFSQRVLAISQELDEKISRYLQLVGW